MGGIPGSNRCLGTLDTSERGLIHLLAPPTPPVPPVVAAAAAPTPPTPPATAAVVDTDAVVFALFCAVLASSFSSSP